MAQTPTIEPASIQAGDTIRWIRTLQDYPASAGWQLSYRLINPDGRIDIDAVAEGDDHLISIPAATSAAYVAGDYTWVSNVSLGGERYTVGQSVIVVRPDWAAVAAGGADARTPAVRALADLRAALSKWLSSSGHVQEYEIAGRRMKFSTAAEIQQRIGIAEREVRREVAAGSNVSGLGVARRVVVRF